QLRVVGLWIDAHLSKHVIVFQRLAKLGRDFLKFGKLRTLQLHLHTTRTAAAPPEWTNRRRNDHSAGIIPKLAAQGCQHLLRAARALLPRLQSHKHESA